MNATMRAVLKSLVPVICPPEAEHLADAIVDHMALTIGAVPPLMQKGLAAGILTYDLGAVPRYGRRAQSLPAAKAEVYFESWEHGVTPLHTELAKAINQLMSLACYEQPEMMARCNYHPGPWIEKVTKRRLAVYSDDAKKQAEQILAPDPLRPKLKKEVA